jgi:predicted ATPase
MADSVKAPVTNVPPYLKQVRIRDYPPLRNAKTNFKPGLNIIIGNNGAGKTRFLSILNKLSNLYQEHFNGAGCELVISGSYEINIKIRENSQSKNNWSDSKYPFSTPSSLSIEASYNHKTAKFDTIDEAAEELIGTNAIDYTPILVQHGIPSSGLPIIDESIEVAIQGRSVKINLSAGSKTLFEVEGRFVRTVLRTIIGVLRNGFTVRNGVPTPSITANDFKSLIAQIMEAYADRFNSYLPHHSPIQSVRFNELFQVYHNSSSDEYIIKGLVLEYQLINQTLWLPFNALSDGTKRVFYLIAELILPTSISINRDRKKVFTADSQRIFFLEEPELGIHPDQLQKLLSLIREVSKEHQVIMTTHSPQVLNILTTNELDRITICELDPKKGTQFRKLSPAKRAKARAYMQSDSYLSDFWLYSNLEAE